MIIWQNRISLEVARAFDFSAMSLQCRTPFYLLFNVPVFNVPVFNVALSAMRGSLVALRLFSAPYLALPLLGGTKMVEIQALNM